MKNSHRYSRNGQPSRRGVVLLIVLVVLVLVMNLLGDFLRDVMNPKLYKD